jgi:hypothetical protein
MVEPSWNALMCAPRSIAPSGNGAGGHPAISPAHVTM